MHNNLYRLFYDIEDTDWWSVGIRRIQLAVLNTFNHRNSPRILDIGCGTGATLKALNRIGPATGLDSSPTALKYCKRRGLSDLILGSVDKLPFRSGKFDIVTMFDVLEHIADDINALNEARRVLKTSGILVLTVPAFMFLWDDHDRMNQHFRRYTLSGLKEKLSQSGYKIVFASYINSILFPVVYIIKQINRLLGRKNVFNNHKTNPVLNSLLLAIFSSEIVLLRRWRIPFGVSLICVARKNY